MSDFPYLTKIRIQGYRPFKNCEADLGALNVIAGANGSGKTSLFEFLRFLRNGMRDEIPPEIIEGSIGQQIFHSPGEEEILWHLYIANISQTLIKYFGSICGPIGRFNVSTEIVGRTVSDNNTSTDAFDFFTVTRGKGQIRDEAFSTLQPIEYDLRNAKQLALSTFTNPTDTTQVTLYNLREYIRNWRFYSSFSIDNERIRRAYPIEQEPILREDAANLSAVLHYFYTEHIDIFHELELYLRLTVPGFQSLSIKTRGRGEVIAYWREKGVEDELSLADLSDGTIRLICWVVLCLHPNPSPMICIDEPDQGVHPQTLPVLAALFQKASERTQLILATHSSYFIGQFDLAEIAIMRKQKGEAVFIRAENSQVLRDLVADFGVDEIELMHRSNELETLP